MYSLLQHKPKKAPWNKGKLVGQKPPLKLKEIWAIRIHLQLGEKRRDLALFNLAIDSKLRACDLLKLRGSDVSQGTRVASRATVMQQKTGQPETGQPETGQPVQFEITEQTRQAVSDWIRRATLSSSDHLFPRRLHQSSHLSARQYARIVGSWVAIIGLDPASAGYALMWNAATSRTDYPGIQGRRVLARASGEA